MLAVQAARQKILALVAGVVAAVVIISVARAYLLEGGEFTSVDPIGVCVSTSYGDHADRWNDALVFWELYTSYDFDATATCSSNKITLLDVNYSGVSLDGIHWHNPNHTSTYTSGVGYLNWHYTSGYDDYKSDSVASHEVGHIVGLAHEVSARLMNASTCGFASRYCTYGVFAPTTDDVNGFYAIY
jgi:hypothetical protein